MSPNARSLLALLKLREATQACIDTRLSLGISVPGYHEANVEDRRWIAVYDGVLAYYAAALIQGVQVPFISLKRPYR